MLENNTLNPIHQINNNSNLNSKLDEALKVGTEALRLPRKINIRELKKKENKLKVSVEGIFQRSIH